MFANIANLPQNLVFFSEENVRNHTNYQKALLIASIQGKIFTLGAKFQPLLPRIIVFFVLPVVIFCGMTGCGSRQSTSGYKILRYNESAGINSLDPAFSGRVENIWAIQQIFNGLVQADSAMNIKPCLAHKWDIAANQLEYTFYLRRDVFFHSNACFGDKKARKMVASDLVYSLNRIADPSTASSGAWTVSPIARNEKGELKIESVGDSILKIFLKEPFSPFLKILATPYCSVIPKEAIQYYGNDFRKNPVGTGPFFLQTWKEGEKLILRKNPVYFEQINGKPLPYLDAVVFSFLKDKQTAFLEFIKGNFDFISGVDGSYKDELLNASGTLRAKYHGKVMLKKTPYLKTDYLGFYLGNKQSGTLPEAYRNKLVRQAISLGIDRKKMIRYLRNNIGMAAGGSILPPVLQAHQNHKKEVLGYDPAKAKRLLEQAGFKDGKGLPELPLVTSPVYQDLCEFIQKQLEEIGIPVKTEIMMPAINTEMIAAGKAGFFRKSWIADYPDAENYFLLFLEKNFAPDGPNYAHFKNENFEKCYRKMLQENNVSRREILIRQADSLLQDEMPVIPLYYDEVVYFIRPQIQFLNPNAQNFPQFKYVDKPADE
jgi:peptide/nickel transport system substrate-binding protein